MGNKRRSVPDTASESMPINLMKIVVNKPISVVNGRDSGMVSESEDRYIEVKGGQAGAQG